MNIIYASGFGEIEFEVLKDIGGKSGFGGYVKITSDDVEKKISDLKFKNPGSGSVLPVRIVLFETDNNKNAITFINLFKSMNIPSAIFAVVTENNKEWSFKKLAGHLLKEHEEMLKKKSQNKNVKEKL